MKQGKSLLLVLALVLLALPPGAHGDTEDVLVIRETQQRKWIADTREKYRVDFAIREAACYQRFAVNDCLLESRRLQRELMADLRRQEVLINDTQRKRRAARQLLRADEKTAREP